jgi:hypothetical protein
MSYVLYNDKTKECPGEWVVRRHLTKQGETSVDLKPSARGRTRQECVDTLLRKHPFVGSMTYVAREDDSVVEGAFV